MTSSPRPASLGRRLMPALALVGVSGALFTQLDHPSGVAAAGTAAGRTATGSTKAATGSAAASTGSAVSPAGATKASPGPTAAAAGTVAPPATVPGTLPPRATPATVAPAARSNGAATPAAAGASAGCGTPVNGPVENTRWGPVQVAAGFTSAGALCSADAVQSPSSHRKSVQINSYAVPVLDQEAMAAKSAAIDIVSGATITSDAYAQSLQSILDSKG